MSVEQPTREERDESALPQPADVELVARVIFESDLKVDGRWEVDDTAWRELPVGEADEYRAIARAVLAALAAAGRLVDGGEVLWQYARPDPDEPDGLMPLDGTPRIVTPSMVRRPLAPTGPWLPVPPDKEI